ncbi:DUF6438 domain-containing protein [Alkanindiges illinoisensis]|uniref:DUF6438 domain-containing protein n=1 Tax=Alkanindiges illinoisensis TaxID=197183 RepID=UPI0006852C0B|nr:DUF6438 domain-containing protein [Alkanindiges illinoisensis]
MQTTFMLCRMSCIAALMGSLAACSTPAITPANSADLANQETIQYTVGPCFGACPVYAVTIRSNGRVEFEGKQHTAVQGTRALSTGMDTYNQVKSRLKPYRPVEGSTETTQCENQVTDQQTYQIVWKKADGRQTVLNHNRGCLSETNRALNAVMDWLPQKLGIAGWIKP